MTRKNIQKKKCCGLCVGHGEVCVCYKYDCNPSQPKEIREWEKEFEGMLDEIERYQYTPTHLSKNEDNVVKLKHIRALRSRLEELK